MRRVALPSMACVGLILLMDDIISNSNATLAQVLECCTVPVPVLQLHLCCLSLLLVAVSPESRRGDIHSRLKSLHSHTSPFMY